MRNVLITVFFFAACSSKIAEQKVAEPSTKIEALKEAYDGRLKAIAKGWPNPNDCDGLLWAGLAKAAGIELDLDLAEYSPGELHRRPRPPCWENGEDKGSKSTISRDMVLGWLWAKWRDKDAAAIKRFQDRAESKNFVIGQPYPERIGETLLTGNLIGLLGRISCEMFKNCPIYRKIEPVHSKSSTDYVQHLTVLFIVLNGEVWGKKEVSYDSAVSLAYPAETTQADIKESEKKVLEWHYEQNKKDALFCTAWHLYEDGNFDQCIDLLMSADYPSPSYVRGGGNYGDVHWLFVTRLILKQYLSL